MRVIMIRHGMTSGNEQSRYIGSTDEPLTEKGIAKAREIGADYGIETVYVTPMLRTKQTAEILFPKAKQVVADDLREMDFGDFEGRNFQEMENDTAYRSWVDSNCIEKCPNGESRKEFSERVCNSFERIIGECLKRDEKQVIFVVHGGTIMAVMERFAFIKKDYYEWSVKNCDGYCCNVKQNPLVLTDIMLLSEKESI